MSGKQPDKLLIEYCPDVLWDDIKPIYRFYFSKVVRFSPELMKMLPSQLKDEYGEGFKKSCVIEGMGSTLLMPFLPEFSSLLFVTHPADRVLVQLNRLRRVHGQGRPELESIPAYVEFLQVNGLDNLQTRLLSSHDEDLITSSENGISREFDAANKLYDDAVENLAKFDWVFFANEFDLALITLYKHFGWKRKPYYLEEQWPNGQLMQGINDAELELIFEMEKYDLDICRYIIDQDKKNRRNTVLQGDFEWFWSENSRLRLKTKFEYFLFDLKERFFGG